MRILIVDDEADIRDLLQMIMDDAGHETAFASTYDSAAVLLRLHDWDVVLTDASLPGGSGLDLAKAARARGLPTLLCSGHPQELEELNAQGIDYLAKPFSFQALLTKLDALAHLAA